MRSWMTCVIGWPVASHESGDEPRNEQVMNAPQASGIGMTSARTRERLIKRLRDQGIANPEVLERIRSVPRHLFVDEALATRAYEDTALPIGLGQTISQPYIVARMTEALLENSPPRKVLEIGTGCGYQTAVLAPLVGFVYTIERIGALLERARARLKDLKIRNVHLRHGDGFQGWAAHAPYDGILVAAAPEGIPQPLLDQLANGGRLIVPVGREGHQYLQRVTRRGDDLHTETLGLVAFVPLVKGLG
jgi:protein-L-isoaspartate(D-aspartate) O-methyltransferase